jgi:ADP-heptose:LPS heptosyltransferase
MPAALVHLASGIGNILLAIPLLLALHRHGFTVDLLVDGDYSETADLFVGWDVLRAVYNGRARQRPNSRYDARIAAIPPFYWSRFARAYAGVPTCVRRPPDALFYRDERAYYLAFAQALGCNTGEPLDEFLPAKPDPSLGIGPGTLVLAPGCKTGIMAAKRWPHFARLAGVFADVALVGTPDDLTHFHGSAMSFPAHVRSLVGKLTLRETAGALAAAGAVVANDSGLGHLAAAVGAPTILLFGPTSDAVLGRFPSNVTVLRTGLPCEPCWRTAPLTACAGRVDCLEQLSVGAVIAAVRSLGLRPHT